MSVRFRSYRSEVQARIDSGLQRNMLAAILLWHAGIIDLVLRGSPRSGRVYKVRGTNVDYTASAPGEPFANLTGETAASYDTQVLPTVSQVGSPLPRSLWLEKGTEKMAPRPVIEPAFHAKRSQIAAALGAEIE
jgi:hypothetical protein